LQIVGQDIILDGGGGRAMVTCGQLRFNESQPNCPLVNITWGWLPYRPKRAAHM